MEQGLGLVGRVVYVPLSPPSLLSLKPLVELFGQPQILRHAFDYARQSCSLSLASVVASVTFLLELQLNHYRLSLSRRRV